MQTALWLDTETYSFMSLTFHRLAALIANIEGNCKWTHNHWIIGFDPIMIYSVRRRCWRKQVVTAIVTHHAKRLFPAIAPNRRLIGHNAANKLIRSYCVRHTTPSIASFTPFEWRSWSVVWLSTRQTCPVSSNWLAGKPLGTPQDPGPTPSPRPDPRVANHGTWPINAYTIDSQKTTGRYNGELRLHLLNAEYQHPCLLNSCNKSGSVDFKRTVV